MDRFKMISLHLSKDDKKSLGRVISEKQCSLPLREATNLLNLDLIKRVPMGEPINGRQIYYENLFWPTDFGREFFLWDKNNKKQRSRSLWKCVASYVLGILSAVIAEKLSALL